MRHGISQTRIYHIYRCMIQRCYWERSDSYKRYGGRGVTVCDEWREDPKAFYDWALNNGYADNLTLDRKDTNGNYEPSNCRWVTFKEQQNNKCDNHLIPYNNEVHTLTEWAAILGINRSTLANRIYRGWDIQRAFNEKIWDRGQGK